MAQRSPPVTNELSLHQLVERAVQRRSSFAHTGATTAYRLLNGAGDELPGLTVDRYGEVLVANLYDQGPAHEDALVVTLAGTTGARTVYVKRRPRSAARLSAAQVAALAPATPAWGTAIDEVLVREHGLRFLIRPGAGLSTGLFLDMRETRARVRELADGRTVLNLFAYTCAFGVAAAIGGAKRVLNVDVARSALEWGRQNYRLNGLSPDPYDFVYGDAFDWLRRLARRGARFDLVIADPPSFSSVKGRAFAVSRDYAPLAAACARVVAPGGLLLCCANEVRLSRRAFRAACLQGLREAGRTACVRSFDGASPLDFPLLPGAEDPLKALLLEL
jgi:23S rRNA (cytosine1962-C5)-methyltransferase